MRFLHRICVYKAPRAEHQCGVREQQLLAVLYQVLDVLHRRRVVLLRLTLREQLFGQGITYLLQTFTSTLSVFSRLINDNSANTR